MNKLLAAAIAALMTLLPGIAQAQSFSIAAATHDVFNREPISYEGTLTATAGAPDPSGVLYTVTGGKGTLNYGSFTASFDNVLGSFRLDGGSVPFIDIGFFDGGDSLGFVSRGGFLDNAIFFSEVGGPIETLVVTPLAVAVPEPAAWALMIVGFGATGAAMRRRVRVAVA